MNIKVDAVSKFGVKVDNKWVSWDRSFKPLEVRKGDTLDIEVNDAGFITKASIMGKESASQASVRMVRELKDKELSRSEDILLGQSLNLAWSFGVARGWNLEVIEQREKVYSLAFTIAGEFQLRRAK